jgi:hypothetical protein
MATPRMLPRSRPSDIIGRILTGVSAF